MGVRTVQVQIRRTDSVSVREDTLKAFAEKHRIPAVETQAGKPVPGDQRFAAPDADLTIGRLAKADAVTAPQKANALPTDMQIIGSVQRGIFTVPDDREGGVDFLPVLKIAAGHGYNGWLVIEAEQDPDVRNPFEYQSLGLKSLKAFAAEAGLDKA